jgi:hypothetical protein
MAQFEGYVTANTPKAILFHGHYWEEPVWLPLSQVTMVLDEDGWDVVLSVVDWLSKKNELIEFTYRPRSETMDANENAPQGN